MKLYYITWQNSENITSEIVNEYPPNYVHGTGKIILFWKELDEDLLSEEILDMPLL